MPGRCCKVLAARVFESEPQSAPREGATIALHHIGKTMAIRRAVPRRRQPFMRVATKEMQSRGVGERFVAPPRLSLPKTGGPRMSGVKPDPPAEPRFAWILAPSRLSQLTSGPLPSLRSLRLEFPRSGAPRLLCELLRLGALCGRIESPLPGSAPPATTGCCRHQCASVVQLSRFRSAGFGARGQPVRSCFPDFHIQLPAGLNDFVVQLRPRRVDGGRSTVDSGR